MADAREMREDELRARLEELVAELRVRSYPRMGAAWGGENMERGRSKNPWAKEERGIKMAELEDRQTAPQAEGHCAIVIEGEGDSSAAARTSSATEIGGAQVRVKEEAASPSDTPALQQNVNKGVYYSRLQYNGKADWRDFVKQFEMMAMVNNWTDREKASNLIACLEEEALHCLTTVDLNGCSSYGTLVAELSVCLTRERDVKPRYGPRADHGRENMRCGGNMLPGASRQPVKAGRYDGRSPWEAYHVKFRMAALTNDWGPTEKAGQLAAALEGEALQVLLDLGPDEVAQYEVLTAALERRFGRVEPAVGLRLQLANRTRAPGEKLGVLAADVRYLARRGYPMFPPATQEDLAVEAFVRGLTPTALRQQVRFAAPTSLELAVAHAERVEAVLEEGERDHAPGSESAVLGLWTAWPPTAPLPSSSCCTTTTPDTATAGKRQGARIDGTTRAPSPVPLIADHPAAAAATSTNPCSRQSRASPLTETADHRQCQPAIAVGRTTAGDFCHVPVRIEGVPCTALVDTGSTVTLIRPDVLPAGVRLEPTTVQLRTVTGELAPMQGKGNLAIEVAGRTVHHPVWVAAVQDPCILGLDFLRYTGGQLNLRTGTLHIQGSPALALASPLGPLGRSRDPFARQFRDLPRTQRTAAMRRETSAHPRAPSCASLIRDNTASRRPPLRKELLLAQPPSGASARQPTWPPSGRNARQPTRPLSGRNARQHVQPPSCSSSVAQGNAALPQAAPPPCPAPPTATQGLREDTAMPRPTVRSNSASPAISPPPPVSPEDPALSAVHAVWLRSCEGLCTEERRQLWELVYEYRHSFATASDDVGRTHLVQHQIETGAARPIKQRPRRQPLALQEATEQVLEEMKAAGIIEPSDSPWTSPVVMVRKKDGKWRFCVDYRRVNDVTEKDSYPLPRIDESLDLVAGSRWFSSLDLRSGYWQVALDPSARPKTAFSTGRGLWQFTVMPFGLCNAPATFERLMEKVLAGVPPSECLVYLDDLLVHGGTFQDALASLHEVLRRVRKAGLKLHSEKCQLMRQEVSFLGHRVGAEGIQTEVDKVTAVRDWPIPVNPRQVRSFLGLASYYRRFVQGFATIAAPLHRLLRKDEPFEWTPACQEAFASLQHALCQSPVLAPPDVRSPFLLDTDASNEGIGAVLSQPGPEGEHVVAYFSRSLSKAERRYCVTRRELLAVVEGVRHFRHYLCGLPFTIRTDHAALQWLLTFREPEGQVARWIEQLQAFQYRIQHRAGEKHANADALSRRPCAREGCAHCSRKEEREAELSRRGEEQCRVAVSAERVDWRAHQDRDPDLRPILHWLEEQRRPPWEEVAPFSTATRGLWAQWSGLALRDRVLQRQWKVPATGEVRWQVVVPGAMRQEVLEAHHGTPGTGHFGVTKTLRRLRQSFYWGQCRRDVEDHCRRCDICTARKGPQGRSHAPLQQYQVGGPMERVAVDVLGPFPRSERGNRFVLVALDYFTKWPEAYALPDQEAETVAEALLEGFFSRFGVPQELHSDQGRNFESRVFAGMCRRLGIKKTRTTPLHPQSDGLVERFNRTLAVQLAVTTATHQRDWDTHLPVVLLACRSAVQDSTACTPALLMLGRELRTPAELAFGRPPDAPSVPPGPEYARRLQDRLESAHSFARDQLQAAGVRQKRNYDLRVRGRHFTAGELVWVFSPKRQRGRCPKLDSHWLGPCHVLERIGDVAYRVQLPHRGRKVVLHRDRLAPYLGQHPAPSDPAAPDSPLLPPPDPPRPNSPPTPRAEGSSPDGSVSLSPVADRSPSSTQGSRPQRQHRLPGRFRDFVLPSGTRD
ncbi:uncharacterized protein LOC131706752 [Acipenser ruthenus]|uniref:uncharacterized protein LOC131706752 n=1 Tax=Acipenser ruthenus TaxID=7906 RepID=UPI002740FF52|nr:uncharacterized protein LOC131706752 [Acipenser ruthenus]